MQLRALAELLDDVPLAVLDGDAQRQRVGIGVGMLTRKWSPKGTTRPWCGGPGADLDLLELLVAEVVRTEHLRAAVAVEECGDTTAVGYEVRGRVTLERDVEHLGLCHIVVDVVSVAGRPGAFAVSTVVAVLSLVVGGSLGVLAGAVGGRVDTVLMRAVDFFSSQNHLLFGLLIAVLARPVLGGAGAVALAVGLTHWMLLTRILRAEVLSLRERPFIADAVGVGANRRQLIVRHVLPHVAPAAGVGFVLLFPYAIFHETALSFLGVGMPPETPSLGTLIAAGQQSLFAGGWWVVLFPGLVIVVAVIAIGAVGEWLRDRTQPRWRGELEL